MSADQQQFTEISETLYSAVLSEVPAWVRRLAKERAADASSLELSDTPERTATWARGQFDQMLATAPSELRMNPLSVLRSSTRFLGEVLKRAGIEEPRRDSFLVEQFPDDVYNLNPASFSELSERLGPMGIAWGAARAYLHQSEHQ